MRSCVERTEGQTYVDFHLLIKTIIHDQTVGHAYPMGLHGVPGDIGIVAHIRIIEVSHSLLVVGGPGGVDRRKACHCRLFALDGR